MNTSKDPQGEEPLLPSDLNPLSSTVSNEELEHQVESKLHGFEDSFRLHHPITWWVTLVSPPVIVIVTILIIYFVRGGLFTGKLFGLALATFFGFGRFVILLGQQHGAKEELLSLTPLELFWMVTFMDIVTAILVAFHIGAMFRIPWMGKRVASLVDDARFVLKSFPLMQRLAFLGLTLFVAFPLASTGAIGGAILGTLLGLRRAAIFSATIVGCFLGNGLLLVAANQVSRVINYESTYVKLGGITIIITVILLMEWRYKRQKSKFKTQDLKSDSR